MYLHAKPASVCPFMSAFDAPSPGNLTHCCVPCCPLVKKASNETRLLPCSCWLPRQLGLSLHSTAGFPWMRELIFCLLPASRLLDSVSRATCSVFTGADPLNCSLPLFLSSVAFDDVFPKLRSVGTKPQGQLPPCAPSVLKDCNGISSSGSLASSKAGSLRMGCKDWRESQARKCTRLAI